MQPGKVLHQEGKDVGQSGREDSLRGFLNKFFFLTPHSLRG